MYICIFQRFTHTFKMLIVNINILFAMLSNSLCELTAMAKLLALLSVDLLMHLC